jgi:hypothetical protein
MLAAHEEEVMCYSQAMSDSSNALSLGNIPSRRVKCHLWDGSVLLGPSHGPRNGGRDHIVGSGSIDAAGSYEDLDTGGAR